MDPLSPSEDAFGAALLAHLRGERDEGLILERDDGSSGPAMAPREFFTPPEEWLWWERQLLEDIGGPVLDLGCGTGRHSLMLQGRGLDVTALDISPGAVDVARERGVADVRLGDLHDPPDDHKWSAVLMMCGNLGLAGGWEDSRRLLSRLAGLCRAGAILVADTVDPVRAADDSYRAYIERNRQRGLPPGLTRLRLRYGDRVTPWWDLLNLTADELEPLVDGTGWTIERHIEDGVDHAVLLRRS